MSTPEIDRLKAAMKELMRKVPASVTGGGMKQTEAYLAACKTANKIVSSPRATLIAAQQAHGALKSFYN